MNFKEKLKNLNWKAFFGGLIVGIMLVLLAIPLIQSPSYGNLMDINYELGTERNDCKDELNWCRNHNEKNIEECVNNMYMVNDMMYQNHCSQELYEMFNATIENMLEIGTYQTYDIEIPLTA